MLAGISFAGRSLTAELHVNKVAIELNQFTEQFLARTLVGAISSLKGAEDMENLELYLEYGDVKIIVNSNELPLTPFPKDIIANTVVALVSSLKGVDKINSLRIKVRVQ